MKLRTRVWQRLLGVDSGPAPTRLISVADLEVTMRVRLLGQIYEVTGVHRTWANERNVFLREVGGPNRLELNGLKWPSAVFELASDQPFCGDAQKGQAS